MKHYPIHLKLDAERDVMTYRFKRRNVYVLKMDHGNRHCGGRLPETLCGSYQVKRMVGLREVERVTCGVCKKLMLTRLPSPPASLRSGMAMPRPT